MFQVLLRVEYFDAVDEVRGLQAHHLDRHFTRDESHALQLSHFHQFLEIGNAGSVYFLAHHAGGDVRHSGNGSHRTTGNELALPCPTLADNVYAHERVEYGGIHPQPPGIDRQDERRIGAIQGVPAADECTGFLLGFDLRRGIFDFCDCCFPCHLKPPNIE